MAYNHDFTPEDGLFVGTDFVLEFPVYDEDNETPYDVTGQELAFAFAKTDKGAPIGGIKRTGGSGITITGVFNIDPAVNTQVVKVSYADEDTDAVKAETYRYGLKRMTDGSETIFAYGNLPLQKAPAPAE